MVEGQEGIGWEQTLALAEAAEAGGFDGLFRSDHYGTDDGRDPGGLDAWLTLAALAARTSRIRLGTLVTPVTFRHPAVLAKSALTVDHVSGGRVEVGIGTGWMEAEHRRWGFPFPGLGTRFEMLEEHVETMRRLWAETRPAPVQRPAPPIIVGGAAGPRSARLAARLADEYNTAHASADQCRERRAALDEACERTGRDPADLRLSLMHGFVTGTTASEVRDHARRLGARLHDGLDGDERLEQLSSTWLVGTIDELAEQLAEYAAAGVERVMLQHHVFDDLDIVRLIGRELIPRLRELAPPGGPPGGA